MELGKNSISLYYLLDFSHEEKFLLSSLMSLSGYLQHIGLVNGHMIISLYLLLITPLLSFSPSQASDVSQDQNRGRSNSNNLYVFASFDIIFFFFFLFLTFYIDPGYHILQSRDKPCKAYLLLLVTRISFFFSMTNKNDGTLVWLYNFPSEVTTLNIFSTDEGTLLTIYTL